MGREWKKGERVAVYEARGRWTGKIEDGPAAIQKGGPNVLYRVMPDDPHLDSRHGWYHPKQLRRLRKRERRRVYIQAESIPKEGQARFDACVCDESYLSEQRRRGADVSGWIEFTESPPRKAGAKERE